MRATPLAALLLVGVAALAAACGDDGDDAPAADTASPSATLASATTSVTPVDGAPSPLPTQSAAPSAVAQPQSSPAAGELALLLDLDPATPGVQPDVRVAAGAPVLAAVVVVNAPQQTDISGGISAFNFVVQYDRTKMEPALPNDHGSPLDGNPDFNEAVAGTAIGDWDCLPAPEGDMDAPGGIEGDGVPASGQAFASCFTLGDAAAGGTHTLATITLTATTPGESVLSFSAATIAGATGEEYAHCAGAPDGPVVRCLAATITVV